MSDNNRKPSRITFSLLAFLGVYPLVTALSYALQPFTLHWQMWQRNLLLVPVMVLTMVFVLIPAINALLSRLGTTH